MLMPWIKEKTMKNGQDIFRENTLYFFLYCEENCCNWLMKEYSTLLTLGWGMFLGGGVLALFVKPWTVHPVIDGQTVLSMAVIILLGTIGAFWLYLSGVQMVGASNASMLASIEPVAATVISVVWLKVQFQMMDLLGFLFVLSTVFIISINEKKKENQ